MQHGPTMAKYQKDFVKKMRNQNRQPRPPAFDGFEGSGHDDFSTKYCYFGCSRPLGIKIFDKDDQAV